MDLHSGQCVGYFDIPVDHVYGDSVLLDYLASKRISTGDLVRAPDLAVPCPWPHSLLPEHYTQVLAMEETACFSVCLISPLSWALCMQPCYACLPRCFSAGRC
jgi:hypothetical protein